MVTERPRYAKLRMCWSVLLMLGACADGGGRDEGDQDGGLSGADASDRDAQDVWPDDAGRTSPGDAAVEASTMDGALDPAEGGASEASTSMPDTGQGDTGMQAGCSGACTIGDSECLPAIGNQRICVAGPSGCGTWGSDVFCGAVGCDADMKRCKTAAGVKVDQWGEGETDEVHAVALRAAGELVLAGYSDGSVDGQTKLGDFDAFVSARTGNNVLQWTSQLGTTASDSAEGVVVDADGNIYVAGHTNGRLGSAQQGGQDAFVRKIRPDRSVEWTTQWGSGGFERVTDIARDDAGNLLVSGWTTGNVNGANAGMYDLFVTKLSAAGNVLWSVQRGTAAEDTANQVTTDTMGNVFVVGVTVGTLSTTDTPAGGADIVLVKISASGAVQWTRQWGSSSADGGLDVACLSGGDLVVAGYTRGSFPNATGQGGGFITRLDPSGTPRWARLLGAAVADGANRIAVRDDTIYTAGVTLGEAVAGANRGGQDIFIDAHKIDGSAVWVKQVGTNQTDDALSIVVAADATVYVGGTTSGSFAGFGLRGIWDNVLITVRP